MAASFEYKKDIERLKLYTDWDDADGTLNVVN
jgi:hypothetical protein